MSELESIDPATLASVSGGLNEAAMSKMVWSRASSQTRGVIDPVGKLSYGPNKSGFVMGHGMFDSKLWGTVERKSFDFVFDVGHNRVQHLQTQSQGFSQPPP